MTMDYAIMPEMEMPTADLQPTGVSGQAKMPPLWIT
jgi:hypothetical protein